MSEAARTVIELQANGPLRVAGPLTLTTADGRTLHIDRARVSLCRCGGSANKPLCDGSHRSNGFTADEAAFERAG